MSIDESAEKLRLALLKKGLSEYQVEMTVKKYLEGMKKIKEGKISFTLANKPKGSGKWTEEKIKNYQNRIKGDRERQM